MALGDAKVGVGTIAAGSTNVYTIRPASGEEWIVHNVYFSKGVEIRMTDGTTVVAYDTDTSTGARMGGVFHLTYNYYMTLRNISETDVINVAFDGIQTK